MSDLSPNGATSPVARSNGKFKPGQSGNRNGRPRKSGTVGGAIQQAMSARVTVTEGGRKKKVTKQEAAAIQLANKSASGDLRAARMSFDMAQKAEDRAAAAPTANDNLTESDSLIVQRLIQRLIAIQKDQADVPVSV